MATSQRIYLVTTNDGKERLVKATQRQQALSHVANSLFTVKVASQDDLVKALTGGAQVEQYKQPDQMEIPE